MGMFRLIPVDVEAYQFSGGMEKPGWPLGWLDDAKYHFEHGGSTIVIEMTGGKVRARKGAWIVRDANSVSTMPYKSVGEYDFDSLYEAVEETADAESQD